MMRAIVRRGFLALLLAAPLAAAESLPVRVDEPADRATLTGNSTAIIRWSGSVKGIPDIEEWEAFLSVDGGRYYAVRITPHLDIGIRQFRWTVPNIGSRDVRLLLRFGNEKNEQAIELPLALRIEPAASGIDETAKVSRLGESARPGDPGVIQWTEGDRGGGHLASVSASIPSLSAPGCRKIADPPAVESGSSVSLYAIASQPAAPAAPRVVMVRPAARLASDILLRGCRRNI